MASATPSSYAHGAFTPKPHLEARSNNWASMPLSSPPPAYSLLEHERENERRKDKVARTDPRTTDSNVSSVYGGQDEYGGQEDRMSILSFISYYEYFRPPADKMPRDSYYA